MVTDGFDKMLICAYGPGNIKPPFPEGPFDSVGVVDIQGCGLPRVSPGNGSEAV